MYCACHCKRAHGYTARRLALPSYEWRHVLITGVIVMPITFYLLIIPSSYTMILCGNVQEAMLLNCRFPASSVLRLHQTLSATAL